MMISGLQAAFIMFHNNAVDLVKDDDRHLSSEEVFERLASSRNGITSGSS